MFANLMENPIFPIILVGVSVLIVAISSFLLIRRHLRSQKKLPNALQKTFLMITLPKEAEIKEGENKQETTEEMLVEAEAFLNALGGMKAQRGVASALT